MTATVANMGALLKTIYPQGMIPDETYQDFPFLSLMSRDEKFYGDYAKVALKYANNSGRSTAFATAQSNQSRTKNVAFLLTRSPDYAVAQIMNEAIEASENDAGALVSLVKHEVDGAHMAAVVSEAQSLAGDGSGVIARMNNAGVATAVVTLANIDDAVMFEVGQKLELSTGRLSTDTLRAGSLEIQSIDRDTGLITMTGLINAGVPTAAVNDYILVQGDWQVKPIGFIGWIKEVAPLVGDNFFGVNRSVDRVRLAGNFKDLSASPIDEAVTSAINTVNKQGGRPNYVFMPFENYSILENTLGTKVQYVDVKGGFAEVGFRGIRITSGKSTVTVLPDISIPAGYMFVVTMNTWKLRSLKKSIRVLDGDGIRMLRVNNADALEIRIGGYKQFGCEAPAYNGLFKI